ncbi:hypothetical protein GCM10028803_24490 [Larkinella knui]|uniref:Outer membrane protein beta-barrel domain-containing protein n=1 Tax=Larkinella knui TaxID=2025310 RepID=A0A3P1CW14_9BACT|nr:hypothetical protein [Larkinella knui]RRB17511.1 hypothetical protein EHT87_04275 [Larkinella knui]
MKKALLLACLCALSPLVQAQTEKGRGIWTGSAQFDHTSQKNGLNQNRNVYRTTKSSFSFSRGVFFKDQWLAGGGLSIGMETARLSTPNSPQLPGFRFSNFNSSLNGFVRRYWGKEKWRVLLGGGLSLSYGRGDFEGESTSSPDRNTLTATPVAQIGANYFLTDRIGLEASAISSSFPFAFSGFGLGLVILTGGSKENTTGVYEAPQTAKGRWVMGGTFTLNTQGEKLNRPGASEVRLNTLALSPSIGWFIKKNLQLGVLVPLSIVWNKEGSVVGYGISPYLKKYVSDNRLRPFVEGNLSYTSIRSKSEGASTSVQQTAGISASAGLAYLLGDRFIVEATVGNAYFIRNFYPKATSQSSWSTGASATLQPRLTVTYVFD